MMIRRILFVLLVAAALTSPARAKDELVVGMEQEAIKLVDVVHGERSVDLAETNKREGSKA